MEAAVRCLRDAVAPDDTACCLVLVADDARVDGEEGMETFSSLLREHADAAAAGRAHARRTVLVAGARAPSRHRLEAESVSRGGPPTKDGDALAVVDLTRDPHGWLASIGRETRDDESARKRAAPRLGDVASVAAAVHDALGGDVGEDDQGDEDEAGEGTHEYVVALDARGAAEATLRENKKNKDANANANANANARGRRSGLWGRAPRERARTVVALDCVAELVHASGVKKTLELIENVRADRRVCGVVAYARGGGGDFETDAEPARSVASVAIDSFARAASRLRRAASCVVVIAPPRATTEALAEVVRRRQKSVFGVGSNANASSFLEEADALHSLASEREAGDGPAARLSAFLSRPTGRFRVERRDVVSRFRFPAERGPDASRSYGQIDASGETEPKPKPKPNASPVLEVSFRAETTRAGGVGVASGGALVREGDGDRNGDENENGVRRNAEAEAEKRRTRLERATPFKLGVSAEESLARSRVVLPFEHQGGYARDGNASPLADRPSAERAYARGDFLRYLPRDAGGESGVAGGGHGERRQKTFGGGAIVYVRDSEDDGSGSAPDSDEELDEDADF